MRRLVLFGAFLSNSTADQCTFITNRFHATFGPFVSTCTNENICLGLFWSTNNILPICNLDMEGCTNERPLLCTEAYDAHLLLSQAIPLGNHFIPIGKSRSASTFVNEEDDEDLSKAIHMSLNDLGLTEFDALGDDSFGDLRDTRALDDYVAKKMRLGFGDSSIGADLTDTDWLKSLAVFDDMEITSERSQSRPEILGMSDEELLQLAIAESMRPLSAFEEELSSSRDYQPGRVGIYNLGSTCYLASAIQVLGHSSRFLETLFSTKFVRPNAIQEAFVKIMHDMWYVRGEPLNPTALLGALHEFRNGRGFTPDASEDAHEALRIILGQLSDASRLDGEETSLDKLFSYTVSRPVRCNACGEKRSKLDTEQDIWLTIPYVVEGDHNPVVTLNDCFEATKQTEVIPDFKCGVCNEQQDATAESTIASGGDVLLISLRRFPEMYKKIHTKVEYPLILEISDSRYDLIGIIHHLGETLSGGHYVSQFRSDLQDQWVHANDLSVLPGTPIKTVSDTAYILVYQRID